MKKCIGFLCFALFLSCDDGDLAIDTVDFDSITTVQTCNTVSATTSNVLFKINGAEALILELPAGLIKNEVSADTLRSSIPGASKLTYRIFTDDVTTTYFCSQIPQITPIVTEEVIAEAGSVLVVTTALDSVSFEHSILLSEISFLTGDDTLITDLQINSFGTVTTKL